MTMPPTSASPPVTPDGSASAPGLVEAHEAGVASDGDAAWHVFLHFQVRDAATQRAFIEAYRPVVEEHVQGWPGFLGATLFGSPEVAGPDMRGTHTYEPIVAIPG